MLSTDEILAQPGEADPKLPERQALGRSREGREIHGYRFGHGALRVSLIAGCHADEPVGPALLARLADYLAERTRHRPEAPELTRASWWLVPHVNPDGRAANAAWQEPPPALAQGYDLPRYLDHVVRELPGDDLEFGFPPKGSASAETPEPSIEPRPEARAVAGFFRDAVERDGEPFHLHATLHGMAFAAGPWFLLEASWAERTAQMQERLRSLVKELGYRLHDVDRGGEKGFRRLSEGFSTRPDSRAMAKHFRDAGDEATARLFLPSSMEYVRSLGGDPLTLVSEMPLFLVTGDAEESPEGGSEGRPPLPDDAQGRLRFREWLEKLRRLGDGGDLDAVRREAARAGLRAMPVGDQMRLQLAYVREALEIVAAGISAHG